MCGIVGYIGEKNRAIQIILEGLKKLEYRGYDSWGVATLENREIFVFKQEGKISKATFPWRRGISAKVGIAHTRWATHGEPTQENAHPHLDCTKKIAIVHNGIIENFSSLKEKLTSLGHKFSSHTDSEVIVHLIEEYLKKDLDFLQATRRALEELQGSYAIVVMHKDFPHQLIAARNGSPLIVGVGEKENFVASDIPALLNYTKKIIVLEDYQMALLSPEKIEVISKETPVSFKIQNIEWDYEDTEKKKFPHYMLKEIFEQPQVIRGLLERYVDRRQKRIKLEGIFSDLRVKDIKNIIIQACGTSFHAGLLGTYLFELFSQIPSYAYISSEFRYKKLLAQENSLLISITQSGETIDTLMGLKRAKEYKLKTLSICNVVASSIARESDSVLYTLAGPEIGVASTKAYTAQIFCLYLLSLQLGEKKGKISQEMRKKLILQLEMIPHLMEKILNYSEKIKKVAYRLFSSDKFLYLGRYLNYPSALEGALKLKEIAYIPAEGYPAGEMKHGPIALIDEKSCVVSIAPLDEVYKKCISNIEEVKARKAKVVAIATEEDKKVRELCDEIIYIPGTHKYLYPLLVALPLQLFAYYVAEKLGREIDQPRNLAKSVTVE
ncbi:MAG: glutamine--fructose-6-phosphate transaminase (isomerizing) [Candidatus Omnitrophica bacterium 4484_70.1]|nr:MAG: glutamine--fructose-6-phosphate transaminase (isomerizing) [Candidatus Omnitrophica bacterium 4484_70.1]